MYIRQCVDDVHVHVDGPGNDPNLPPVRILVEEELVSRWVWETGAATGRALRMPPVRGEYSESGRVPLGAWEGRGKARGVRMPCTVLEMTTERIFRWFYCKPKVSRRELFLLSCQGL